MKIFKEIIAESSLCLIKRHEYTHQIIWINFSKVKLKKIYGGIKIRLSKVKDKMRILKAARSDCYKQEALKFNSQFFNINHEGQKKMGQQF